MSEVGSEHGQDGPTVSRPTFLLIQVLRGLAALMVVAHHASILVLQRLHLGYAWVNGSSGVDLFFVISGFVMTISSRPLLRAAHPARTFLARRLERIVPMYWIVTLAKVLTLQLWPGSGTNDIGNWQHVLSSLLFLPSVSLHVVDAPVLVVGWTLNFEMAFYLLFSLALTLRVRPLWIVGPPLLVAALCTFTGHLSPAPWVRYYQGSIVLDFLGGILLAMALSHLRKMPWGAGLALLIAGMLPLLFFLSWRVLTWRGVIWGVPAMAVVAGVLCLETRWGPKMPRWALQIGDASYSIYLVHTFVLPAIGMVLMPIHRSWRYEVTTVVILCTVLSAGAGLLAYRWVERPINEWFKGRRRTAIPAVATV